MAAIWTSTLGIFIVAWTLREIFMDLFQPSGTGSLSPFVGRRLFQIAKLTPSKLRLAGPLSIVVVIFCWALLLAAGFAFITGQDFRKHSAVSNTNSRARWVGSGLCCTFRSEL
jgi:hypothetical protein